MKEKRGLGDCPQGFDFVFDFDFHASFYPKRLFRVVFAKRPGRLAGGQVLQPGRAPAPDSRKNHAGIWLRIHGRVKIKVKNKNKIKTLGAILQTHFFFRYFHRAINNQPSIPINEYDKVERKAGGI
ncbi:MAG: hypothetical protein HQL73_00660 [Magnetococcales bacterium]|nr:hypothetical protein [Magnetococcales bacterium]